MISYRSSALLCLFMMIKFKSNNTSPSSTIIRQHSKTAEPSKLLSFIVYWQTYILQWVSTGVMIAILDISSHPPNIKETDLFMILVLLTPWFIIIIYTRWPFGNSLAINKNTDNNTLWVFLAWRMSRRYWTTARFKKNKWLYMCTLYRMIDVSRTSSFPEGEFNF